MLPFLSSLHVLALHRFLVHGLSLIVCVGLYWVASFCVVLCCVDVCYVRPVCCEHCMCLACRAIVYSMYRVGEYDVVHNV